MDQDKEARRLPYANYQGKQLADLHLWMTTQEAAEHSGYDVKHVRRLARQGKTGAVKNGRDWWIDEILPGELGVTRLGSRRRQVEAQGVGVVPLQEVGHLHEGAAAFAELCPLKVEVFMVTGDRTYAP